MPPGNAELAKAAALCFSNTKGSDCVIRFCLEAKAAEADVAEAKRRRLNNGAEHEREGPFYVGEPLPAHQFVLRCVSEVFDAQLERWKDGKRDAQILQQNRVRELDAPSPLAADAGSLPELLISLGSEDEVPSALAAIRYAYTGELPTCSAEEVLRIRRQICYLQIEGCSAACDAALKAKLRGGNAAASSSSSSESQRPPVLDFFAAHDLFPDDADPSFAGVLALAKQQLVLHFADTVTTLNTLGLLQELLQLPAVAMEALLASNNFGTDSEASVFMQLALWMRYNKIYHGGTDLETRKRLCRLVRLMELSPTHLNTVLPSQAADYEARLHSGWFPIPAAEVAFISCLSSTPPSERGVLLSRARSIGTYDVSLPSYSTLPRRQCLPEGGRTFSLHFTQQQLQKELQNLQPGCVVQLEGDHVIVHGVFMQPLLSYKYGDAAAAVGLSCHMPWDVKGLSLARRKDWVGVVSVNACLSVARWPDGARGDDLCCHCDRAHIPYIAPGPHATLPLKQQAAGGVAPGGSEGLNGGGGSAPWLAAWSDYIHDGKITCTLTILPPGGSGVNSAGAV